MHIHHFERGLYHEGVLLHTIDANVGPTQGHEPRILSVSIASHDHTDFCVDRSLYRCVDTRWSPLVACECACGECATCTLGDRAQG